MSLTTICKYSFRVLGIFCAAYSWNAKSDAPCTNGATLQISTPPSATATAGVAFATQAVLRAVSGCNLVAQDYYLTAYSNLTCTTVAQGVLDNFTKTLLASAPNFPFVGTNHTVAEAIYFRATADGMIQSACVGPTTVGPSVATHVAFATQPSVSGTINTTLSTQPTVGLYDVYDNLTDAADVSLSAFSDAGCSVAGSGTFSAADGAVVGLATIPISGAKYSKMGDFYIKVASTGLTSACSNSITLSAGTLSVPGACSALEDAGYTVSVATARDAGAAACASNEKLLYARIKGVVVPKCVAVDCGPQAKLCRSFSGAGGAQNYYCAQCTTDDNCP